MSDTIELTVDDKIRKLICKVTFIVISAVYLYTAGFGSFSEMLQRALLITVCGVTTFLDKPFVFKGKRNVLGCHGGFSFLCWRDRKNPVPKQIPCWDRMENPAVPPGLTHRLRPLCAYQHTLTFDNGAPRSGAYTQGIPLSGCPRKSIGPILFCRDYSTRGSLGEKVDGLLTLPQRFIAV